MTYFVGSKALIGREGLNFSAARGGGNQLNISQVHKTVAQPL